MTTNGEPPWIELDARLTNLVARAFARAQGQSRSLDRDFHEGYLEGLKAARGELRFGPRIPAEASGYVVYIAGPLSGDNLWAKTRAALRAAEIVVAAGGVPFIPHLFAHWAMATDQAETRGYESWMYFCFVMVSRCNALFRIEGESSGADREVKLARALELPVFFDADEAGKAIRDWNGYAQSEAGAGEVNGSSGI